MKMTDLAYYLGDVKAVWCGHAADSTLTGNAASGGVVSALLLNQIQSGAIDGALVWRLEIHDGKLTPTPVIATNQAELLAAQGSIYCNFAPCDRHVRAMVREFPGRLAVVGLPCGIKAWRRVLESDPELRAKVVLLVGLFCGHTSRPQLIRQVLQKKQIDPAQLRHFRFGKGLWRGYAEAVMRDGTQLRWPAAFYKLYQNLFIQAAPQCMSCFDHFAEQADWATGDIWSRAHRNDTVKHSIFCARTPAGCDAVQRALESGALQAVPSDAATLFAANRRAVIFHKAIAARARVGRWCGVAIRVPETARRPRWNEWLAAWMIVPLYRFSISRHGGWLLRVPRLWWKAWLYGFKGLTNF